MQSESINELAAALAKAQAVIEGAVKHKDNSHLKNKYADLGSVWDACRSALTANGLSVTQTCEGVEGNLFLRTTLMHASGQWVAGDIPLIFGEAKGLNPMQALGSALSYARRYGLASIVGVSPEDDDGHGAGQGRPPQRQAAAAPAAPPAQTTGQKAAAKLAERDAALAREGAAKPDALSSFVRLSLLAAGFGDDPLGWSGPALALAAAQIAKFEADARATLPITPEQAKELDRLADEHQHDPAALCEHYRVGSLAELQRKFFAEVRARVSEPAPGEKPAAVPTTKRREKVGA
jgi:hypothetical protein